MAHDYHATCITYPMGRCMCIAKYQQSTRPVNVRPAFQDERTPLVYLHVPRAVLILVNVLQQFFPPKILHKHEVKPGAILALRPHQRAIFSVVHKRKRYFNWFIATSTERYFRCYLAQWKI